MSEPWFVSRNGASWKPVSWKGWAALAAFLLSEFLVTGLAVLMMERTGSMAWIAAPFGLSPFLLGGLFVLISRKGAINSDKG